MASLKLLAKNNNSVIFISIEWFEFWPPEGRFGPDFGMTRAAVHARHCTKK
jgi:hypothetical protein